PDHIVRVTTVVAGQVMPPARGDETPPREGQLVEAGQILVRLDDRLARAARNKAHNAVKEQEEQKDQADNAVELAQLEVKRLEDLSKGGAGVPVTPVPRIEVDRARLALKDAESRRRAAQAKLDGARAELAGLDRQLE